MGAVKTFREYEELRAVIEANFNDEMSRVRADNLRAKEAAKTRRDQALLQLASHYGPTKRSERQYVPAVENPRELGFD